MPSQSKLVLLGIDGLSPKFVKRWSSELPNLMNLQKKGIWGEVESIIPLSTPQVWTSIRCSQKPGTHGIWDFTFRNDFSYGDMEKANSRATKRLNLLETVLPKMGQRVGMISMPATWPPPKIPAGYAVSGITASASGQNFTHPGSLKEEIRNLVGEYVAEVTGPGIELRTDEDWMRTNIYTMDSQRFTLTKYLVNEKNCDFVITNVRGAEYMLSLLYYFFDSKGKTYTSDPNYENLLHDYYVWIDGKIGELHDSLQEGTVLLICSGYSAQKL